MVPIIISAHGNLASELIKSVEMIAGKQELCKAVNFYMGEDLDKFMDELEAGIRAFGKETLCLVDLRGGTPFNMLVKLCEKYPFLKIITGVNMPMLLQTVITRQSKMDIDELLHEVIDSGKKGIEFIQLDFIDEDDDF